MKIEQLMEHFHQQAQETVRECLDNSSDKCSALAYEIGAMQSQMRMLLEDIDRAACMNADIHNLVDALEHRLRCSV